MEYVLKDVLCEDCKSKYIVLGKDGFVDSVYCMGCFKPIIVPCEKYNEFVKDHCEPLQEYEVKSKTLECSSKGDKRFSALYAKVKVNGVLNSIENHYQNSKVFKNNKGEFITYNDWKKGKGKKPIAFLIEGYLLPLNYGTMFYNLLWYKYLKCNKELEKILEQYDYYSDLFRVKGAYVCQADVINEYMNYSNGNKYEPSKRGIALYNKCEALIKVLKGNVKSDKRIMVNNKEVVNFTNL
ncbi:DarT1-associated NADAR antitoxin family protein [Clostridium perfringens]|uniref:Uncharacterized protein n=1 Tax=Clostridium perfringens TaxID=1502 RepID=A0A140GS33_CLOPF|nr:hypothetical protein [Clostridium perfringens]AMN31342.1 hypothetical protein JFP838_pA0426 [Clostridium perfringens]